MKKCKNCSKQRQCSKKKKTSTQYRIVDQYGIGRIASDPRIVVCNDEYMLELLFKNQKKTNKLNKQVKKIKRHIHELQKSLENSKRSRDDEQKYKSAKESAVLQYQELQVRNRAVSKTVSVSSSKRQIGRFTRVSEGESQSFSKHSLKEEGNPPKSDSMKGSKIKNLFLTSKNKNHEMTQKAENRDFVSFSKKSKQASQNYLLSPIKMHKCKSIGKNDRNKSRNSPQKDEMLKYIPTKDLRQKISQQDDSSNSKRSGSLIYSSNGKSLLSKKSSKKHQNDEEIDKDFDRYMPTYQQVESSFSNLLLDGQNEDSSQILSQKARLQRQFQQLIIQQKNATHEQRKIIREQINALSQMLKNLSD